MTDREIKFNLVVDTSDAEEALQRVGAAAWSLGKRTERRRYRFIAERLLVLFGSALLGAWLGMLLIGAVHSIWHSWDTVSFQWILLPSLAGSAAHEVVRNSKT